MLNLRINGQTVPYDTLDEARKAAKGELSFWRETFELCAKDEKFWNDFINELWQNGGAEEAVRLYAVFAEREARRWVLMALLLKDCNNTALWKAIVSANNDREEVLIDWLKRSVATSTSSALELANDAKLKEAIIDALNGSDDAFHDWLRTVRKPSGGASTLLESELEYWQKRRNSVLNASNGRVAPLKYTSSQPKDKARQQKRIGKSSSGRPDESLIVIKKGWVTYVARDNKSITIRGSIFKGKIYKGMDVEVRFWENESTCSGVIEEVFEKGQGIPVAYKSYGEIAVRVGVKGRYSSNGIMSGSNCSLYNTST